MPRNRSLPPHLEIRKTGYYWRRRLPRSLRDRGAMPHADPDKGNITSSEKSFLCFSLRIHVLRDAKILARRLTGISDQVLAALAEKTMTIAPDLATRLLEQLARFEIDAYERARAIAEPRSHESATFELRREEALQDTLRRAILLGDREIARAPLRHVAACLGLTLDEAEDDWKALAFEATKVLLDVNQERLRRQQGHYDQPTPVFRRAVGPPLGCARPASRHTAGGGRGAGGFCDQQGATVARRAHIRRARTCRLCVKSFCLTRLSR